MLRSLSAPRWTVGLVSLLAFGCSGGSGFDENVCSDRQQIVAGSLGDETAVPAAIQRAIGSLAVFEDPTWPEPTSICTTSRLADNWLMTAGHCYRREGNSGTFSAEPRVSLAFNERMPSCIDPTPTTSRATWYRHPSLDLMLIHLLPPEGDAPPAAPHLDLHDDASTIEEALMAGFGLTENYEQGTRKFVAARVLEVSEATIVAKAEGDGGACFGDSGGPLLAPSPDGYRLIGVLSRGSSDCRGTDEYVRLDSDDARTWLDGVMQSWVLAP